MSRIAIIVTTAKASLISYRSTCPADQPAFSSTRLMAPAGVVVNHSGACAKPAYATTRARGVAPAARAADSLASTSAAAPSEIEEELAAVTVPSLLKEGFRLGNFLISMVGGVSSLSTTCSPLRFLTVTGVISAAKLPLAAAACARRTDSAP